MNYRTPVLIHPDINKDATPVKELLSRFNRYGEIVEEESYGNIPTLLVIARIDDDNDLLFHQSKMRNVSLFRVDPNVTVLVFYLRALQIIRKLESKSLMLIAGDLKFGLLIVTLIPKFLKKGMKKQFAMHGHLNINKFNSLKRGLKYLVVRNAIKKFDSIRVVSKHLQCQIQAKFKVSSSKMVVAPIPVLGPENDLIRREPNRPYGRILVLGRLHPERGIAELLDYINEGLKTYPNLTVTFIGEGPELSKVEDWKASQKLRDKVKILGRVEHDFVLNNLNHFDILVSNAPHEGFGLAIREAALAGLIVVARFNSGTNELKLSYGNSINLFRTRTEFQCLLEEISLGRISPSDISSLRLKQRNLDQVSLRSLIWSWISI